MNLTSSLLVVVRNLLILIFFSAFICTVVAFFISGYAIFFTYNTDLGERALWVMFIAAGVGMILPRIILAFPDEIENDGPTADPVDGNQD